MKWIKHAKHLHDYQLAVTFDSGETLQIDFQNLLNGPIFEPLKSMEEFLKFYVHAELEILAWPNGADYSPDFLYEEGQRQTKATA